MSPEEALDSMHVNAAPTAAAEKAAAAVVFRENRCEGAARRING